MYLQFILFQLLNHWTPCTRRYTTTYSQIYTQLNGTWPAINYTSPVLHHTVLTGLAPATMYAPCWVDGCGMQPAGGPECCVHLHSPGVHHPNPLS